MLHAPAAPVRSVLILPPLVEERKACHRILRDVARELAAEGAAVLRFDYRGTGDSDGAFDSFTLSDWLADAEAAKAWLTHRFPGITPTLLGIRFGATLATHLASPCTARLLVEPLAGADLIKQLLQRNQINQMIAFGKPRVTRALTEAAWQRGETADLDGYPFTAQLAQDLAAFTPQPWSESGCIISTGTSPRTADAAQASAPAAERLDLRLPAFWNTVGHIDLSALSSALVDAVRRLALTSSVPATTPLPLSDADRTGPQGRGPSRQETHTPPEQMHREGCRPRRPLAQDNALLRTTGWNQLPQFEGDSGPVAITTPAGTIRGWIDAPASPPRARLLFIHGWSGDRTGPHRMFVKLARALAAEGVFSLRIDLSGRGDSDGETAAASIDAMTEDTRAALDWLRRMAPDNATPLLLVAICSGCKVAVAAAAVEPDLAALALWSAESMGSLRSTATRRRKTRAALKTYALKLTRRETWVKLLTGRVRATMVTKALVSHETRSDQEAKAEDRTLQRFSAYTGDLLFVFGGSDPDAIGSSTAYAAYCRKHGLRHTLKTIPHAGHSFYQLDWESDILAITTTFIHTVVQGASAVRTTQSKGAD